MTDEFLNALLDLPRDLEAQVSPDGRWVAWAWRGAGETVDVYAAPTDGSHPPIQLTAGDHDTRLASWTPDSRAVLVTQDYEGDERYQLFRVDVDAPGVMQPLTDAHPNFYLRGGNLHPDRRWLVYGANVDEGGEEIDATWIYRHDLFTRERLPLARPQRTGFMRVRLSPTGDHVLYYRRERGLGGLQVWMANVDGTHDREIVNVGDDDKAFASWFPDGQRVLVLAEARTHFRVGVWSLDDESLRWLIDDPLRNIEDAYAPFGSDQIVIVEQDHARVRCSLLDPATGVETHLPAVSGNLQPLATTPDGAWVGLYFSSRQPTDLVRFTPGDAPEQFVSLTRVWQRTPFTPADFVAAEDYRWRSVDGLEIQGWLWRARGAPHGTIIYVHGGPTAHVGDRIVSQAQYFASQGFNVLAPNYRGSTGFSRTYQDAIKHDGWGGREQDDIRTGIEALIADGIAQPGKVGITGTSYGGYSSWHAITHFPPEIVAASAPICGMTDLVVDYETTRPDLRPYCEEMLGGSQAQMPERYYERSPIHFVSNIRGRLLIVQGLQDPNVTPENMRVVRAALDQAGIEHQLLAFDNEGHGISRKPNLKILYEQLAAFFADAFEA
ncbi:MAG: prolyl oligopeptidase family serine peptidase [Anaerolineae bacterium]